jgi:undecaprenyl-diphosphatase
MLLLVRGGAQTPRGASSLDHAANHRSVWYWLAAVAFAFLVPPLLKYGLRFPRPWAAEGMSPWGFPSAHALRVTVIYGFLGVMVVSLWPVTRRWPVYWLIALIVFLVGFSRLYLGVHWLSDVLGGVLLGSLWVAALGLAYRHHPHGYPRGGQLLWASGLTLVLAMSAQILWFRDVALTRYTPERLIQELTMDQWLAGAAGGEILRDGVLADRVAPLNIEYVGDPSVLERALARKGWRPAERLAWGNVLKLLSTALPLSELPVFPQVHDGRHDEWLMALDGNGRRYAMRLWSTDIQVLSADGRNPMPLWRGNIGRLEREVLLGWVASARDAGTILQPSGLIDDLAGLSIQAVSALPLRLMQSEESHPMH